MLEMPEQTYTLLIAGIALLVMVPVFLIGKKSGAYLERIRRLEENRFFEKKVADVESGRNELLREIEDLRRLNEKYLFLFCAFRRRLKISIQTLHLMKRSPRLSGSAKTLLIRIALSFISSMKNPGGSRSRRHSVRTGRIR